MKNVKPFLFTSRSTKGQYLGATKNGTFKVCDGGQDSATQWEY